MADIATIIPATNVAAACPTADVPSADANAGGLDLLFAAMLRQVAQEGAAGAVASAGDFGQPSAANGNGVAAQPSGPYAPSNALELIALLQNAGSRQDASGQTVSTYIEPDAIDETEAADASTLAPIQTNEDGATQSADTDLSAQPTQPQTTARIQTSEDDAAQSAAALALPMPMPVVAAQTPTGEADTQSAADAADAGKQSAASSQDTKDAQSSPTKPSLQPQPDIEAATEVPGKATSAAEPIAANAPKNSANAASLPSAPTQDSAQPQNPPAAQTAEMTPLTAAVAQAQANPVGAASFDASLQVAPRRQSEGDISSATLDALGVAIAAKSFAGVKHFDIRLEPPELGRVAVRLSVDATGKAQASLVVDKPQTLELLQSDAANLTRALSDAGLEVASDGLSFSLREQNQQNAGESAPSESGQPLAVSAVAGAEAGANPASIVSLAPDSVRLDIRV